MKPTATGSNDIYLPWTFGFAKFVGASALHTKLYQKVYGSVIQLSLVAGVIVWVITSRTFESGKLQGFIYGTAHLLTTLTSVVCAVFTWKNHELVKQSIALLGNLEQLPTTRSDVNVCLYGIATFLIQLGVDSLLDRTLNLMSHLENFVYYMPLLINICVTNQFVVLVKQSAYRLDHLIGKLKFGDFHPYSIIVEYNIIREACVFINDAYSVQNAWCIFRHSIIFTSSTYYIGLSGSRLFPAGSNTRILILSSVSALSLFSYIVMIFKCCEDIQRKYKLFKNRFYDKLSTDPRHSVLFASRPIYKSIKFSAAGVFDLDMKTLNTTVLSMISYVVIMLQFAVSTTDI
ncbi:Hypothetical protein NTJ_09825 [Nesidiocoris tenuis]|uniref:Gustatory receptor n=1 Tax=Nesidiocoris tenuis TaxID=355587 RepID=A0ABN7B2N2_9HEMI|nr:Hypothetical protein NTJ_09825 [Nesidiocoris tenuis]